MNRSIRQEDEIFASDTVCLKVQDCRLTAEREDGLFSCHSVHTTSVYFEKMLKCKNGSGNMLVDTKNTSSHIAFD